MRYEAFQDSDTTRLKGRKRVPNLRCWSVWQGSENGRLVGSQMTEADAKRVAALLNAVA